MTTHADVPEFELNIDAEGRVRFQHPAQAHAYLKRYAGELIVGQFYPVRAKRSDRQNRAAHLPPLAWARERGWAVDTLRDLRARPRVVAGSSSPTRRAARCSRWWPSRTAHG